MYVHHSYIAVPTFTYMYMYMYVTDLLIMHELMCHLVLCCFNDHRDTVAPIYCRQVHVHVRVHVHVIQPALTHYHRNDVSTCRYAATTKKDVKSRLHASTISMTSVFVWCAQ